MEAEKEAELKFWKMLKVIILFIFIFEIKIYNEVIESLLNTINLIWK